MLSDIEVMKSAEVQVWKNMYYESNFKPIEGGLLDPRMVYLIFLLDMCICVFWYKLLINGL